MSGIIDSIAKKDVDRRTFLTMAAGAATLSSIALSGCAPQDTTLKESDPTESSEEGATWIAAACWSNCGGHCLNKVLVKDGIVLRQKTDDTHEDSIENPQIRGCVRGRSRQQQVFGADRLKYPMRRRHWEPLTGGEKELRGQDEWERISWDEAYELIADELEHAIDEYGNGSIYYQDQYGDYMKRLLIALGGYIGSTGTMSSGTWVYDLCGGYTGLMSQSMGNYYGCLNDRFDLENADYIVLYGSNPAWSGGSISSYYLKNAKNAGAKFLYVGPEYPVTASMLDAEWIPVRPATDTAFLLGVAHSMLTQDVDGSIVDWDFIERYTVGFDAEHMPADAKTDESLQDYLMGFSDGIEKSAAWASGICGTPVELIEHYAQIMGKENNVSVHSSGGPARHKGAENFPQALYMVSCLGGHIGKPGNGCGDDQNVSRFNRGPSLAFAGQSGMSDFPMVNPIEDVLPYPSVWRAVLTGKYTRDSNIYVPDATPPEEREVDIHVLIDTNSSFLTTTTDEAKGIEAYRKVDFALSVAYTMKAESVYADIVLPACTPWERPAFGGFINSTDRELVHAYRQIIEPLYESKSDYEIVKGLAEHMGLDVVEILPLSEKQMWFNTVAGSQAVTDNGSGFEPIASVTQEDLDRYGVEGKPQEGKIPFEQFLDDGIYRVTRSKGDVFTTVTNQAFREDPEANPLETPSGKVELYCQRKGDYFDITNPDDENFISASPLPKYLPQNDGYTDSFANWETKEPGPYPIMSVSVHYPRRTHVDQNNCPWLREAFPNTVQVNSSDAAARGIENGDVILVRNELASFIRPASVSESVMPGVIVIPHGALVDVDEESGIDRGGAVNRLVTGDNTTSVMFTCYNTALCEYEKYTGDIELLPDAEWPLNIPIAE